ncbi:MAG: hypothetical protein GXO28_02105 [Methanopyri archaeon]|nr:hypothetical protein [Methanopyri archaeon]
MPVLHVPGAVTGFFHPIICSRPKECGSPGFGISIREVVRVEVEPGPRGLEVKADEPVDTKVTTISLYVLRKHGVEVPRGLKITYSFRAPPGCGMGTSAASALGTIAGVAAVSGENPDRDWVHRRAHEVEILAKTGVGDVTTIYHGGAVLRLTTGYPDEVITVQVKMPKNVYINVYDPKPLETRDLVDRIPECHFAENLIEEVADDPRIETAMEASLKFAEHLGMFDEPLKKAKELNRRDEVIGASVAMLSGTVFAVAEEPDPEAYNTFKPAEPFDPGAALNVRVRGEDGW